MGLYLLKDPILLMTSNLESNILPGWSLQGSCETDRGLASPQDPVEDSYYLPGLRYEGLVPEGSFSYGNRTNKLGSNFQQQQVLQQRKRSHSHLSDIAESQEKLHCILWHRWNLCEVAEKINGDLGF